MSLLIQDGRRGGHLRWATQAIGAGVADGVVINPFHTPRVAVPRHYSGSRVVDDVRAAGGEAIFDPSTHARLLPTSNDTCHYDTWQLWGPSGIGLDTDSRRLEHLERVFARQDELGTVPLAPTLTLDSPSGVDADHALRTAQLARGLRVKAGQALVGRRSFWRAGPDLDVFIGQIVALRSPLWCLTVVNDIVADNQPDMTDTAAFVGLLRTVHSLSQRSRVVVCYADYAGVPALAAGAETLTTGWDRGMRYFDPRSFQITSNGIQIPASYVTQGGLGAVLRRDTGDAITRLGDPPATRLRGGPMPADDTAERSHHLRQLQQLASQVTSHGRARRRRVAELRGFYEQSTRDFNALIGALPRRTLNEGHRKRWIDDPYAVLREYARAERLWA